MRILNVYLKKARYLILSSKRFGSDEALSIGMIDEVVEDEKLEIKLKPNIGGRF